jgi:hypothetical protein
MLMGASWPDLPGLRGTHADTELWLQEAIRSASRFAGIVGMSGVQRIFEWPRAAFVIRSVSEWPDLS